MMDEEYDMHPANILRSDIGNEAGASILSDPNTRIFENMNGLVADLTPEQVKKLKKDPKVLVVEEDQKAYKSMPWGIDRIDQASLPLDDSYTPPPDGGKNVNAYVLDTGIKTSHKDFEGRASWGNNFSDDGNDDVDGHGTHCAGTVGGAYSGVAKKANLIAVKVLSDGGWGYWSWIIDGMNWVKGQKKKDSDTPMVVNLSIGGGKSDSVNAALESLVKAGVTTAVAAGNSDDDACYYSPASATSAITVGSTSDDDNRSYFSNYGDCLDIYAPGSNIESADNDGGFIIYSGTSMAAPHVAGVAALLLGENPNLTPREVQDEIESRAVSKVKDARPGSPKLLLQIGSFAPSPPIAPTPPVEAPTRAPVKAPTPNSGSYNKFMILAYDTETIDDKSQWKVMEMELYSSEDCSGKKLDTVNGEYIESKSKQNKGPDNAFDGSLNTFWFGQPVDYYGIPASYIGYEFAISPKAVRCVIFQDDEEFGTTGVTVEKFGNKSGYWEYAGYSEHVPGEKTKIKLLQEFSDAPNTVPDSPTESPRTIVPTPGPPSDCKAGLSSMLEIDMYADESDKYWKEYSWVLQSKKSNNKKWKAVKGQKGTLEKGYPYDYWTDIELCKKLCYRILFKDTEGDGMCCDKGQGYYSVTVDGFQVEWSHWLDGKQKVVELGCSPKMY